MQLEENLDSLEPDDLATYLYGLAALQKLGNELLKAKRLRVAGKIQAAILHEQNADLLYSGLPDWCKTW